MVKVLFRRPCHVPPCLINGEGGSSTLFNCRYYADNCLRSENDWVKLSETRCVKVSE